MRSVVVVGVILLLAVTALVVQNQGAVTVGFFFWQIQIQLGLALIAAAVLGALIMYISAVIKHRELRGQIRGVEARLREAEERMPVSHEETESVPHP